MGVMITSGVMTSSSDVLPGAGRNASLRRAFQVLECLAFHAEGASVAALARETELPRATVTRLLASLADAGAVVRSPHQRAWTLGPTITRLARALGSVVQLRDRARPLLEELMAATNETAMLGVPAGPASAQVVDEVEGPRVVGARRGWSGRILVTPASAFVRMVLAELPDDELERIVQSLPFTAQTPRTITKPTELLRAIEQIRREDHCIVVDEFEMGLAGVGVPVRRDGVLIAMFAIYLPTTRFDEAMQARALALLLDAAARLAASTTA
jgi:DNA-binding IclR family transcriptional regulator